MYTYHALINALSTHIIHINLNTIFCTYVEDSPIKAIYIRHYMETHVCAQNVYQKLSIDTSGVEIQWEGFQFGFKRWQGWAVSRVGVNSKCGVQGKRKCESHEFCICIAEFSACGCQKKSVVYETECKHKAVQRGKQDQNYLHYTWAVGLRIPQERLHQKLTLGETSLIAL